MPPDNNQKINLQVYASTISQVYVHMKRFQMLQTTVKIVLNLLFCSVFALASCIKQHISCVSEDHIKARSTTQGTKAFYSNFSNEEVEWPVSFRTTLPLGSKFLSTPCYIGFLRKPFRSGSPHTESYELLQSSALEVENPLERNPLSESRSLEVSSTSLQTLIFESIVDSIVRGWV